MTFWFQTSALIPGKEYVGIVRLHNAIESEHVLARVSLHFDQTVLDL